MTQWSLAADLPQGKSQLPCCVMYRVPVCRISYVVSCCRVVDASMLKCFVSCSMHHAVVILAFPFASFLQSARSPSSPPSPRTPITPRTTATSQHLPRTHTLRRTERMLQRLAQDILHPSGVQRSVAFSKFWELPAEMLVGIGESNGSR